MENNSADKKSSPYQKQGLAFSLYFIFVTASYFYFATNHLFLVPKTPLFYLNFLIFLALHITMVVYSFKSVNNLKVAAPKGKTTKFFVYLGAGASIWLLISFLLQYIRIFKTLY